MTKRDIVCVVDDDARVRRPLCMLIESLGVMVRAYAGGHEFLDAPDCRECDCLVLDVRMPGISGIEVQAQLAERGLQIPTIFITGHGDVPMAVEALRKGAVHFLQKPVNDQVLLDTVVKALEKGRELRNAAQRRAVVDARKATLTQRETDVLELLIEGKPNKTIARELGISIRTAEDHRASIMKKMQVHSVAELVRLIDT